MNIEMRKTQEKFYVNISSFSEENPKVEMQFLTTKPDPSENREPFDFVNMVFFGKDYSDSVSITIGKESLEKFMAQMESVVKEYKEKNCVAVES